MPSSMFLTLSGAKRSRTGAPRRRGNSLQAGFTLVEVLAALAIAGLALGAAATIIRDGMVAHATAGDVDTALALAREKIAAAGVTTPLRDGADQGVFADRFAWRLVVSRYDDTESRASASPHLYRIAATITWRDGLRGREVALATLRLAPDQP
jgi:general secretion pathway protein I